MPSDERGWLVWLSRRNNAAEFLCDIRGNLAADALARYLGNFEIFILAGNRSAQLN
jgi:hypothetical protein